MGLKPSRTLLMLQNQCYFSEILFAVSLFLELTKCRLGKQRLSALQR